jgi:hypothetical protein
MRPGRLLGRSWPTTSDQGPSRRARPPGRLPGKAQRGAGTAALAGQRRRPDGRGSAARARPAAAATGHRLRRPRTTTRRTTSPKPATTTCSRSPRRWLTSWEARPAAPPHGGAGHRRGRRQPASDTRWCLAVLLGAGAVCHVLRRTVGDVVRRASVRPQRTRSPCPTACARSGHRSGRPRCPSRARPHPLARCGLAARAARPLPRRDRRGTRPLGRAGWYRNGPRPGEPARGDPRARRLTHRPGRVRRARRTSRRARESWSPAPTGPRLSSG